MKLLPKSKRQNIVISVEEWLGMLQLLTGQNLVKCEGIPQGAVVIGAHYDFARHSFVVKLEHESYPACETDSYLRESRIRFVVKVPIETDNLWVFRKDD